MRRTSELSLIGPLLAIAVGALAAFVISFVVWSKQIDHSAQVREESLVTRGVSARIVEMETAIFAETNWDEAVRNLDLKFDPEWAQANLTAYFEQVADFDAVFVLNGKDVPIYASVGGEDTQLAAYGAFAGAADLIRAVREAENRRGPLTTPARAGASEPISKSIQKSAFLRDAGGRVRLITASLVQPDFGTALPSLNAPVVVTSLPVDGAFLDLLSTRFQLSGLHMAAPKAGEARALFTTLRGQPLSLAWTPQKPGTVLLRAAIVPVILVILAVAAVAGVMIWRVRRATREMLAVSRAQTDFLANMSHELRTPLNGVIGLAAALERTPLNERQADFVRVIRNSGETLEHLLSDILDLASLETDSFTVRSEAFSPADVVRDAAAHYALRAQAKGVALEVMIDPGAEGAALGDVARVKQIACAILDNAVKFTAAGKVAVVLERLPDGPLRLVVEDTGVGFDPSQARRIFKRFQQADGSITRQFGGAGLGLSIAQQLATMMGGTIEAAGRPGKGATFTLTLPLAPAEASELAAAKVSPSPAAVSEAPDPDTALRILLSDDHPTNRQVVQALLADAGVDLVSTENGLEACEAFERQPGFQVVLMDMQMPVMDGLSAIRRIRKTEATNGQPRSFIIMLTANALPEHRDASLAAGADLHVPKPIQAERLFAALNQAFDGPEREIEAA